MGAQIAKLDVLGELIDAEIEQTSQIGAHHAVVDVHGHGNA